MNLCKNCNNVKSQYKDKQNNIRYYCKNCNNLRTKTSIREFKQKCIEYKGSKCSKCGYDKCIAALDFHHINKNDKNFQISKNYKKDFLEIKSELDKCVLLCANCHREEHYEDISFHHKKKIDNSRCLDCNIKTKYTKRCNKCNNIYRCKNIPSKEQLEQDLIEFNHNLSAIGRKYSVSDNAVRKWIKSRK